MKKQHNRICRIKFDTLNTKVLRLHSKGWIMLVILNGYKSSLDMIIT